jgi:hypothetical protein
MQGFNIRPYTQYTQASPKFRNHNFYIHGFETLFCTLSYVKNNKGIVALDIDDQNTTYVFAPKTTRAAYLNLDLHQHQGI